MTILVIKLGALGDVIQSLGAVAAIRAAHDGDRLLVLTQPGFDRVFRESGLVDGTIEDTRPKLWQPHRLLALRRRLRAAEIGRVYDLQMNDRTRFYARWMFDRPGPDWSGNVPGCRFPHPDPAPKTIHGVERHRRQLAACGIDPVPDPDVGFLTGPIEDVCPTGRFVLLVPGSAPSRPEKRWPAARYAELATRLANEGVTPVLLGTKDEAAVTGAIAAVEPRALDLTGRTDLGQIAELARRATGAVGNDTGPMHIVALTGCPTLALFGPGSDPDRHRPIGPAATVLRADPLATLSPARVRAALPLRG